MEKLSDKQVLEAYLADPQKKEQHIKIAQVLHEQFGDRWFSVKDVTKKTAIKSEQEASQMIIGLNLFHLLASKQVKNIALFKIVLTKEQRIKVLNERKKACQMQIEYIDKEIEKIQAES